MSPDIWVESTDPDGNAVPGEPNFVHARIFNLGKAPSLPTRVDFFWGNPAIGLGPKQMHHIGTEWTQIQPHAAQDVRCNTAWIPVYQNNGHECLIVNCTNPILDPIAQPFHPVLDRHVGQRNLTVLKGGAGQKIKFKLGINNFFPVAAQMAITARTQKVVVAPGLLATVSMRDLRNQVAFGLRQLPSGFRTERSSLRLVTSVSKPIKISPTKDATALLGHFLLNSNLVRSGRAIDRRRDKTLHNVAMEPFEQRRLDLELGIPANAKSSSFIVVDLLQTALGLPMGGYAIVIRVL